jgi:hypothetical protein
MVATGLQLPDGPCMGVRTGKGVRGTRMGGGDQHRSGRGVHSLARPLLAAATHSRLPVGSGFIRRAPGSHDRPLAGSGFATRARGP